MASHNVNTPIIQENEVTTEKFTEHSYSSENNNLECLQELKICVDNPQLVEETDNRFVSQTSCPTDTTLTNDKSSLISNENAMSTTSDGTMYDETDISISSVNGGDSSSSVQTSESKYTGEGFNVPTVNDVILRSAPHRGIRQAMSEFMLTSPRKRSFTVQDAKEQAHIRLQDELVKAQTELKLKDEECDKLSKVRDQMELELDELTAALFEEANKMVQDAYMKRSIAEKQLEEAKQQIEVLQADIGVFKSLVLTSTPNTPNRHLNPQIDPSSTSPTKKKDNKPFWKGHKRSTSHHDFTNESRREAEVRQQELQPKEVDHSCYIEFVSWRENAILDHTFEFLSRIMTEDILPCLNFSNDTLSKALCDSIKTNSLMIEPIAKSSPIPRKCCLTDSPNMCSYKIKLDSASDWLPVSQHCRNRIAAVCDFYTYIRYIVQGLVKNDDKFVYNEVVRLRRHMAMARLGYS